MAHDCQMKSMVQVSTGTLGRNKATGQKHVPLQHADSRIAAFLPTDSDYSENFHIVDRLIRERCPSFVDHWVWPLLRPPLYTSLEYGRARRMADEIGALPTGADCFDYLVSELGLKVDVTGLEHLPSDGRLVVISNHPTGLADGGAIWSALGSVRRDVEIFANADACRVNPAFADVIIPVEWVEEKRSPTKTRETLRRAAETFKAERCLVIFPSGRLAIKEKGVLKDRPWFPTAVSLARKNKAPIVPVHIDARNSHLFYFLSHISRELKDITLFRELLNKGVTPFKITIGRPIQPEGIQGDPTELTEQLKRFVEGEFRVNHEKQFEFR